MQTHTHTHIATVRYTVHITQTYIHTLHMHVRITHIYARYSYMHALSLTHNNNYCIMVRGWIKGFCHDIRSYNTTQWLVVIPWWLEV